MRPDLQAIVEAARKVATGERGRPLLRLVDDLVALGRLSQEVSDLQQAYWALVRNQRASEAERQRALDRSRAAERRWRAELQMMGFAPQASLPLEGDPRPNSPEDVGYRRASR